MAFTLHTSADNENFPDGDTWGINAKGFLVITCEGKPARTPGMAGSTSSTTYPIPGHPLIRSMSRESRILATRRSSAAASSPTR